MRGGRRDFFSPLFFFSTKSKMFVQPNVLYRRRVGKYQGALKWEFMAVPETWNLIALFEPHRRHCRHLLSSSTSGALKSGVKDQQVGAEIKNSPTPATWNKANKLSSSLSVSVFPLLTRNFSSFPSLLLASGKLWRAGRVSEARTSFVYDNFLLLPVSLCRRLCDKNFVCV